MGAPNVWADGQLVATYSTNQGQTVLNFHLMDWLGTRRVLTDSAGNTTQSCDSLPYGDGESCPPTPTEHLFTGKERDSESGNDYFGARYYASTMGRMMSPDPHSGTLLHMLNPLRWNMYSYALNNPVTMIDPTGKDAVAVNFVGEVPVGGHEGILVVNKDENTTYARFGPKSGGHSIR